VTKDPIGFAGGDVNLYNYVGGNPVNEIDPEGLAAAIPAPSPFPPIPVPQVKLTPQQWQDMKDFFGRPAENMKNWFETRGNSDPYTLPTVNPGRDCNTGKCNPCPSNSPVWEHTHKDGSVNKHQIVYDQNPNTCECKPRRIHVR
jgi:uncharacterized protein RhaS with RHS repeats